MEGDLTQVQLEKICWLACRRLATVHVPAPEDGDMPNRVWYFANYLIHVGGVPYHLMLAPQYENSELAEENLEAYARNGLDGALNHLLNHHSLKIPARVTEGDHRGMSEEDWRTVFRLMCNEEIYLSFVTNKERRMALDWLPVVINNCVFYHASTDGTVAYLSYLPKIRAMFDRWGSDGLHAWSSAVRGEKPLEKYDTAAFREAFAYCKRTHGVGTYEYYRDNLQQAA